VRSFFVDEMPEPHRRLRDALAMLCDGQELDVVMTVLVNAVANLAVSHGCADEVVRALALAVQGKSAASGGLPPAGEA
jgi:hypothetical protein